MRVLKENMFFVLNNKIIMSVINFSTAASKKESEIVDH